MKSDFSFQSPPGSRQLAKYFSGSILGVFFCVICPLEAQEIATEVISGAGETQQITSEMLISWTLGEGIVESYSDGQMMLVQGFHQPKITVTVVAEADGFKNTVSVYPNPAVDYISIRLGETVAPLLKPAAMPKKIKAELHDLSGRVVNEVDFESNEYKMDVHFLANGVYLLRLTNLEDNTFIGSYSIEKLK
ncbi:MAG: T9SS type A sorting domain-containing protein [Bacteroidota bacterium]